jgi:hypothetical protein
MFLPVNIVPSGIVWDLCFGPSITSSSDSFQSYLHLRIATLSVKSLSVVCLATCEHSHFCSVGHHPFTEIYPCSDVLVELSSCIDFVCGTVYQKNTTFRKLGLSVPHVKRCKGMYSRWGKIRNFWSPPLDLLQIFVVDPNYRRFCVVSYRDKYSSYFSKRCALFWIL